MKDRLIAAAARMAAAMARASHPSRSRRDGAPSVERLERREVLSGSASSAALRGLQKDLNVSIRAFAATDRAAPDGEPSNALIQDAREVGGAYGAFNATFLKSASALRPSGHPSASAVAAYDSAIASAAATLDSAIASDLSNLPRTGPALSAKLQSDVAGLATGLQASAAAPGGSTSASLVRQGDSAIAAALGRATSAILADSPPAQVPSSALTTYDAAATSAFATFRTSILAAQKASIAAKTPLSPSSVSQALVTLRTSLVSSIAALGPAFTSSPDNPDPALAADINKSYYALTTIPLPKVGAIETPAQFQTDVKAAVENVQAELSGSVVTSVQSYNTGLL